MGGTIPTNEVLNEKLDNLKELIELKFAATNEFHQRTNNHLANLNGQVSKNSEFRLKAGVLIGVSVFIIPTIVSFFLNKVF